MCKFPRGDLSGFEKQLLQWIYCGLILDGKLRVNPILHIFYMDASGIRTQDMYKIGGGERAAEDAEASALCTADAKTWMSSQAGRALPEPLTPKRPKP